MGIDKICVVYNALEIQLVRNEANMGKFSLKLLFPKKRNIRKTLQEPKGRGRSRTISRESNESTRTFVHK